MLLTKPQPGWVQMEGKKKTSVDGETPAATFHCQSIVSDYKFRTELTKRLQAGLDELLPTRPLGQVSEGHGGLVEPVRAARRRDPRPGAAAWCPSPCGEKKKHRSSEGREGLLYR